MKTIVAAFVLSILATSAFANCAPRDTVAAFLGERFGEQRHAYGLAESGQAVEVFVSSSTGTWTIIVTSPDLTSCVVASGVEWESLPLGEMG